MAMLPEIQYTDSVDMHRTDHPDQPRDCEGAVSALVSKQFYDLAVSHLYRRCVLGVNSSCGFNGVDEKILKMLDSNNRGLSYIRELVLEDNAELDRKPKTSNNYPEVRILVYLLPKNILQSFAWNSWHPLPSGVYRELFSRQRSLTELELNYSEVSIDDLVGNGPASLLGHLNAIYRLRIMPGPREAFPQAACDLMKQHQEIKQLTLDMSHNAKASQENNLPLDSGILQKLFANMKPSTTCLRVLDLTNVNLRGHHDAFFTALNFQNLRELMIVSCQGLEDFLLALNNTAVERPSLCLTRFGIYQSREWLGPNYFIGSGGDMEMPDLAKELDIFLATTISPLRELWVCLRGFDRLPDVACITPHGTTLEWLFLDVRTLKGAPAAIYPLAQWQKLYSNLEVVHQLDTAYPPIVADCDMGSHRSFSDHMRATVNIPSLKALGITDWPYPVGCDFTDQPYKWHVEVKTEVYYQLLAALANDILAHKDVPTPAFEGPSSVLGQKRQLTASDKDCHRLSIITFGMLERLTQPRNIGYGRDPACFVKTQYSVWAGESLWKMEPVGLWNMLTRCPGEWRFYLVDTMAHEVGKYEAQWTQEAMRQKVSIQDCRRGKPQHDSSSVITTFNIVTVLQPSNLYKSISYQALHGFFTFHYRIHIWHPLPKTTHNDSMDCHTPRSKNPEMLMYFGKTRHRSTKHDDSNEMANVNSERSRFGNLSVELLHLIFDQKNFYSVAVKHLYNRLEWDVLPTNKFRPLDQKLLNMLDPLNRGLQFIRHLRLADPEELSHPPRAGDHYPEVDLFVHFLPVNTLHSFRWKSWHDLPSHVYRTLLRNQRSLKELELNCTDTSIEMLEHDGDTHPMDRLEIIQRLRVMPCPEEGIPWVACRLFKQHIEIEDLILDLWHMPQHNEDDANLHWLHSSATLLRELFTGVGHYSCRHLRKIELSSVNLHNSHQHLVPALRLNSLVKLKLVKCRYPEGFLRALTRTGDRKLLSLKGFAIYHSRAWEPPANTSESSSLVTAISDFLLHSSNSLRKLWICLRGYDELPATASIARHGSTLQWLFLDVRKKKGPWAPRYGYEEWHQLCRSLTAVRQIDTTYPAVVADCHNDKYSQFSLYMSATVNIPTIRTVGVNNWPFPTGALLMRLPGDMVNRDVYRLALATLAHDIVKLREVHDPHDVISGTSERRTSYLGNCPQTRGLSVVVFGMSEDLTHRVQPGYGFSPGAFVKSLVQLWDGEYRMRMELVDPQELNKESPHRWKNYDVDRMAYDVGNFEFRD
ncbi:MAG: hypothetical protein Q9206_004194 [Seirophora lacunosa]